ncbi:MFS transporter [Hydrogenophaga sp.]|uniref:MFS transporter n=1 Tax=Hydrogenophaga sp. TaxID=1904254 RepID=UPI00271ECACA|nr:MFS transporter [Hydrogenophaga sp.]MDO8906166.1 MFS transporter [Hydrogenophaga sp.]
MDARAWRMVFAAALLMGLVMGTRSSFGLFVSPLNTASGIGLTGLSLALALGQLAIGFSQPVVGLLADRFGAARVIVAGAWLLMLTTAVPALWPVPAAVALSMVAAATAGSAVGSNGLLVGEVGRAVPAARMGLAVGIVGAGASLGQLLLGPATQALLDSAGWVHALLATALISLVALPLARPFRRPANQPAARPSQPVGDVMRDLRFWRVSFTFGVCGFHVGFLAVHMPGVIERCGLPASLAGTWIAVAGAANIVGSVAVGLAMKRHDSAHLLVALYLMRALGVGALLLLPSTPLVLTAFAVVMGATHMATLPPTTQLVARQHGVERLGTLFGVVMLVHQLGSFAGIWLGGWAAERTGSDTTLWLVDIALALLAALLVWPSRLSRSESATPNGSLAVKA